MLSLQFFSTAPGRTLNIFSIISSKDARLLLVARSPRREIIIINSRFILDYDFMVGIHYVNDQQSMMFAFN